MKVCCPACGIVVPTTNIYLDTGWGKCEACNEVFPLADVLRLPRPALKSFMKTGSFMLPADSDDERDWLLFEINDFLEAVRL